MGGAPPAELTKLREEVGAAALPADCQQTIAWCVGQLPALYARYCAARESRDGDEITRLVRGALQRLAEGGPACPEAGRVAAAITDGLRLLHERLGLPALRLQPPKATRPRS
jgi:hypothetical protein